MNIMTSLLALFATIFLLNVVPAFAPPTWMVMSWIGFSQPDANPALLAGVAACAATAGRLVLARLSCVLVRNRWMREADRQNIDVIRAWLEDRKGMTVGLVLAYAFSPFPSNFVFIAYGLTSMRLWLIGLPFFVGRWVSYLTWTHIAQIGARYLDRHAETYREKFAAATVFAEERGWVFITRTEIDIRTQHVQNLKFLHRYRHTPADPVAVERLLAAMRRLDSPTTPDTLLGSLADTLEMRAGLIPVLWHLVAHGEIQADLQIPLTDSTQLFLPS